MVLEVLVEHEIGKSVQLPMSQAREIQLVSKARGPCIGKATDMAEGLFHSIDERHCGPLRSLADVVVDGAFDISGGRLARDDEPALHPRPGWRARLRKTSK